MRTVGLRDESSKKLAWSVELTGHSRRHSHDFVRQPTILDDCTHDSVRVPSLVVVDRSDWLASGQGEVGKIEHAHRPQLIYWPKNGSTASESDDENSGCWAPNYASDFAADGLREITAGRTQAAIDLLAAMKLCYVGATSSSKLFSRRCRVFTIA